MSQLLQYLAARKELEVSEFNARAEKLRVVAGELADELRGMGASRVRLVGSLADPHANFHADTDIDLCVWGLSKEILEDMTWKLWVTRQIPIDLLCAEEVMPSYLKLFERFGKDI